MPFNRIQPSKRAKIALAGSASAIAIAVTVLIQPWEGRSLIAYRDMVGVLTICDGDTTDVHPGMKVTPADCDQRTWGKIQRDYLPPLEKCIPGFTSKPKSWQAAMLSLAWNVGDGSVCNSTAAKLARAGDLWNSCIAATRFNKAGGSVVTGIVHRREMGDAQRIGEAELCVSGL